MMTATRPSLIEGFEVEWCSSLGKQDDPTSFNPDRCEFSFRDFAHEADAVKFAKKLGNTNVLGDVRITPFYHETEDDSGVTLYSREYSGDSKYYE